MLSLPAYMRVSVGVCALVDVSKELVICKGFDVIRLQWSPVRQWILFKLEM